MPDIIVGAFGNGNSFLDLSKNKKLGVDPEILNRYKYKSKGQRDKEKERRLRLNETKLDISPEIKRKL